LINLTHDRHTKERFPSWSADGAKIAFQSNRSGQDEIWVMAANGTSPQQITTTRGRRPAWSPDGTKLAFEHDGDVWTIDAQGNGTHPRVLTSGADPTWAPDGKELFFVRGAPKTIFKILLQNRNVTTFVRGAAPSEQPKF